MRKSRFTPQYARFLERLLALRAKKGLLQADLADRLGVLHDRVTRANFTITEPRTPEDPPDVTRGLEYRYYEGDWEKLPNFDTLTPVTSGTIAGFDLTPRARDDQYAFTLSGFVSIPREGVHTFYTSSDDGSKLYVGEVEAVDNDGLHGMRERSGRIGLKAGLHAIRVIFFEHSGGEGLEVRYEGPGTEKRLIPTNVLYHAGADEGPE